MQRSKKLYAYVDESGQDTLGELFLVAVVITGAERESIRRQLRDIEHRSGKRERKWTHSTPKQREAYMRAVMHLTDLRGHLYYSRYADTRAYVDLTILSTAKALHDIARDTQYQAIILVDGLGRIERHRFAAGLRKLKIPVEKVRGARDQSDEYIRLADAVAGFIRDGLTGKEDLKEIYQRAKSGFIREI